jgi:hypothetical protein
VSEKIENASGFIGVCRVQRKMNILQGRRTKKADGMGRVAADKPQSPEMAMSDGV